MYMQVWTLISFVADAEQEEWEKLETVFLTKPTPSALAAWFKKNSAASIYHQTSPNPQLDAYIESLLMGKRANVYGRNNTYSGIDYKLSPVDVSPSG